MENTTETKITTPEQSNSNLITCKHCGAQMAKSAKKCPSCGGKNKVKSKKKLLVFGIIILAIIIVSGVSSVINTIKINNMDFEKGNAAILLADHRSNEAAANEKYAGEAYYFIGIVDTIGSSSMEVCVDGNLTVVGAMHSYGGEHLECNLSGLKNEDYFYENVKEGSTVMVKGTVSNIWNGTINLNAYYVELYEGEYEYTYLNGN